MTDYLELLLEEQEQEDGEEVLGVRLMAKRWRPWPGAAARGSVCPVGRGRLRPAWRTEGAGERRGYWSPWRKERWGA